MPTQAPLHAGIEPYPGCRLRQFLGRGGFAEVWEAEVDGGKPVALKFMPCDGSRSASKEIRSLQSIRQLDHPGLVRVDRVWIYESYLVIGMELAEGSLDDLQQAYRAEYGSLIPGTEVCLYLSQVAEVLDFLNTRQHRIGGRTVAIQHCDVKPSNLLLFGDAIKLADFGLASAFESRLQSHGRAGTLNYAAPEVFQGRLSDTMDQFALAVTYCELRTGRWPFPPPPADFNSRYQRPAPDLSILPAMERPIVARALDRIPQNRWPSCGELINRLAATVS